MRLLFVLTLVGSAACAAKNHDAAPALFTTAANANLHTAANPGASFEAYRTFSFGPFEGAPNVYQTSVRSAEVQRRLQPFIAAALAQKGYVPAAGKGDLFVVFGSGVLDVSTDEISEIGAEWLPDDEDADFVDGSLVIDAFDGGGGHEIWHGASRANIDPDRIDDPLLQRSVRELLSSFPKARTTARVP